MFAIYKDNVVSLFDARTLTVQRTFKGDGGVSALEFSPDGNMLATYISGAGAFLWDTQTGLLLHNILQDEPSYGMKFSPDGTILATTVGRTVTTTWLWDSLTGKLIQNLTGYRSKFAQDSNLLVTFDGSNLHLWEGSLFSIESFVLVENDIARSRREIEAAKQRSQNARQVRQANVQKVQEQIRQLLAQARAEEEEQDQKWFGKNYDDAIRLYQQAIDLGSEAAKERLRRITAR